MHTSAFFSQRLYGSLYVFSYPGSLCLPKGFPLSSTLYLGTAKQTSARIESYRVPMYNFLAPTALHTATAVCPLKSVPAVSVKVHLHHRISHMTCGADEILGKAAKPKLQCSPLLIFFSFFSFLQTNDQQSMKKHAAGPVLITQRQTRCCPTILRCLVQNALFYSNLA